MLGYPLKEAFPKEDVSLLGRSPLRQGQHEPALPESNLGKCTSHLSHLLAGFSYYVFIKQGPDLLQEERLIMFIGQWDMSWASPGRFFCIICHNFKD